MAIESNFRKYYRLVVLIGGFGLVGWTLVRSNPTRRGLAGGFLGSVWLGEMIFSMWGFVPQCDRALYYPELPVLAALKANEPGRICGVDRAMPPMINVTQGIPDVRGYDAVDPNPIVRMLMEVRHESTPPVKPLEHARLFFFQPRWEGTKEPRRLPGAFNMLNPRYLLYRKPPERGRVIVEGDGYWIVDNAEALPRVFLPREVASVADSADALRKVTNLEFNASEVSYVEGTGSIPLPARGRAVIVEEISTRVVIEAELETGGLVVLADQWHPHWQATVQGSEAQLWKTNYAIRGVEAPAGKSRIVFEYVPRTLNACLSVAGGAVLFCIAWGLLLTGRTILYSLSTNEKRIGQSQLPTSLASGR
jgi:hypothetical protein